MLLSDWLIWKQCVWSKQFKETLHSEVVGLTQEHSNLKILFKDLQKYMLFS